MAFFASRPHRAGFAPVAHLSAATLALGYTFELQRKVGQLASFTAKGDALDAEALARCNG